MEENKPEMTKLQQDSDKNYLDLAEKMADQNKYEKIETFLELIKQPQHLTLKDQINYNYLLAYKYAYHREYHKELKVLDEGISLAKKGNLTLEVIMGNCYKGNLFLQREKLEEAKNLILKIDAQFKNLNGLEKKESKGMIIHLLRLKVIYFQKLGKYNKCNEIIEELEAESQNIHEDSSHLFISETLANFYFQIGDFEKAIQYYMNMIDFAKKYDNRQLQSRTYVKLGDIFLERGDLYYAWEYFFHAFQIAELLEWKYGIGATLTRLAEIYLQKGDYVKTTVFLKRALAVHEADSNIYGKSMDLLILVQMYADMNNKKKAHKYVQILLAISKKYSKPIYNYRYLLAKACTIKIENGIRNIISAGNILRDLVKEKALPISLRIKTRILLADSLFQELLITKNESIIDEIQEIIQLLANDAAKNHSFSILAESTFLKGKLELIKMEIHKAQISFTQALQITQKYQLIRLEKRISLDYDLFLEKINDLPSSVLTMTEIEKGLELINPKRTLRRMMKKQELEDITFKSEDPLFLTIISKAGIPFYTYNFVEEWQSNNLFSNFITALSDFSQDLFSQRLDRIKIGTNTIIMVPFHENSICYVLKGQTYPAQEKLQKFIQKLSVSKKIISKITQYLQNFQIIKNGDYPALDNLVESIFFNS